MQRIRMRERIHEWNHEWNEYHRRREEADELREVVTTHAFNMIDFMFAVKDFCKRLSLSKSIFHYQDTMLQVFFSRRKGKNKECMIFLKGFEGASWFDYQIQLTRFLQKDAKIIEVSIIHNYAKTNFSKMVVVFLLTSCLNTREAKKV